MYQILLFHIYMKLNMFRATHRPSSGAWNCTGSLWFFIRGRLFVHVVGGRCWAQCAQQRPPTTCTNNLPRIKTRGCQCSFRLLMKGGVSPVVGHTVPNNIHQLHVQTTFHIWKTRGCQCSFRLLMMGGVSPETCWASYKYGIIKFGTLLHLVGFFFMNFPRNSLICNMSAK